MEFMDLLNARLTAMSLKRQYDMTSIFLMASMTDVIFLLLIFFYGHLHLSGASNGAGDQPAAESEQTAIKPARGCIYRR